MRSFTVKALTVILAAVMLSSCVAKKPEKPSSSGNTVSDTQNAGSSDTEKPGTGAPETTTAAPETEPEDPALTELKNIICREWAAVDEGKTGSITLDPDGHCNINGKDSEWELIGTYDSSYCSIGFADGSRGYISTEMYSGAYLMDYVSGDSREEYLCSYGISEYTITAENREEYFEELVTTRFLQNSFGEDTGFLYEIDYVLKEKYGSVIEDLSYVAIEYELMTYRYVIEADPATGEIKLIECIPYFENEKPTKNDSHMFNLFYPDNIVRYGIYGPGVVEQDSLSSGDKPNLKIVGITRIEGKIITFTPEG